MGYNYTPIAAFKICYFKSSEYGEIDTDECFYIFTLFLP